MPGNRMMRRAKLAILAFITDVGGQTVLTVVGFVTIPIILNLTSRSLYGFWITAISILGYLGLTDLGLGISLTRLVASLVITDDTEALNRVISTAFFTFCAAGLVFFGLGMGFVPFIPGWFSIPSQEVEAVISAYCVVVFSGAIALPLSIFSNIIVGYQKMAISNIVGNLINLASIMLSLLLLFAGIGLVALALASLFTVLATNLLFYFYARRCFPALKIRLSFFNRADLKKLLSFGGYFQIGRIANTVAVSTDSIVIAGIMGAAQVTPYALTSKLPILFSQVLASKIPGAVFPAICQMFADSQMENLRLIFMRLTCICVRLAIVAAVFIFLVNRQFVKLWVGAENYGGDLLNLVFVYWILQDTIYRGTTAIVYASGDLRGWTITSIVEAILNIVFTLLLIRPLGLVGVALGTSIGKTLTTGFYVPYWICRKLELSGKVFLKQAIFAPFLRSLPGVCLTILISGMLSTNCGWLGIAIVGSTAVLGNFVLFEGLILMKTSNERWPDRLRKLIKFDIG